MARTRTNLKTTLPHPTNVHETANLLNRLLRGLPQPKPNGAANATFATLQAIENLEAILLQLDEWAGIKPTD